MLEPQVYRGAVPAVTQQVSDEPVIEVEDSTEDFARIVAAPLPPGFGTTLGNALRRALLSSLPGAAVTSVRIDGVQHEFSTIPNVKEDTIEFLLNVKELRLHALSDRPGTLVLDISGREGAITAGDIQVPEHYEVVNPDLYLATVDSPSARLYVEFNVEQGRGYVPAGQVDGTTIGVIPVDAIFSPVRKVNYKVEPTRVGQATNYDKLIVEVWTDGSITAVEAVSKSADILIDQFKLFSNMGRPALPVVERGLGAGTVLTPDRYNMPIEDLNLSMRAYNCLRRSGLMTVGQVLEKSEEELLALRNFGRKSYDELREKLDEMGLLAVDHAEEEIMEALPLDDEEAPIAGAGAQRAAVAAEGPAAAKAAEAPEEGELPSIEPAPVGRTKKSRAKAAAAPAPAAGEEEEIPDWKRKLLELTGEEGTQ
ncbi:MAG: DNA-directed RNA polymerase subunit alpha [Dehalococcoidia bacterium]|nr:DNA-directed RNA polymerase subunit alpha [Dehalococcoidia bacterium]